MSEFEKIKVEPENNSDLNESQETNSTYSTQQCEPKKCKCGIIINAVLAVAIVVLYLLFFLGKDGCKIGKICKNDVVENNTAATFIQTEPGNGSLLYVDLDTINEKYIYISKKKVEIENEMQKQEANFKQRQAAFQKKYEQFQQNLQSGVLTEVQIQNTQIQLQSEYEKMENDYNNVINRLTETQVNVNQTMLDSLYAAANRVNQKYNASYIITYQKEMPILIYTDATKNITDEVLFELNKAFQEEQK